MAAHDAVLPTTQLQTAAQPQKSPSRSRPYTYVPPDCGYRAASRAEDVALQYATTAAMARPMSRPEPAAAAAGPNATKIPAPIIEPSPIVTASAVLSRRRSEGPSGAGVLTGPVLRSGVGAVPGGGPFARERRQDG